MHIQGELVMPFTKFYVPEFLLGRVLQFLEQIPSHFFYKQEKKNDLRNSTNINCPEIWVLKLQWLGPGGMA